MNTIEKQSLFEQESQNNNPEALSEASQAQQRLEKKASLVNPYREDKSRESLDTKKGFAIDRDGRVNNYAVKPAPYLQNEPRFGFTRFAEVWNGRLAMIGFAASIITELIAGKSLFAYWFGLG